MENTENTGITVETTINAQVKKVWQCFTDPKHVMQWYHASDDWHAPYAENDLKPGGSFSITMAAKDGSASFNLSGEYTQVDINKLIEYKLADNRKVSITFAQQDNTVKVTETFDPEGINPHEVQKDGWQAILDNFKKYAESN